MKISPQEALEFIGYKYSDKQDSNEPYLCNICNHVIHCTSCGIFKVRQQEFVVDDIQY